MSDNVHIIEFSAYEPPTITESTRFEWVEYGDKNDYYSWLIDRYKKSSTNNAVINNVARLIYGGGINCFDAGRKPNEYAMLKSLVQPNDLRNVALELKMLGQASFQILYDNKREKIKAIKHIPINLLRPEKCNEDGEITGYYYSDDWSDIRNFEPKRIPAFGYSTESIEVYVIKPYSVGLKYFSLVDYYGSLPYAILEEEIADYLINEVQNKFSGTKVINFNNGTGTEETRKITEKAVRDRLTGAKGQKVIIAFNDNKEMATTIDDISLDNASEQYAFLSKESQQQILVGHNVVSPMLVGVVTDNQGFSSNADEIEIASKYFNNIAIKPFQELIIDALDELLAFNGVSLDLYFKPLNLLGSPEDKYKPKEESVQMSKEVDLDSVLAETGADDLEGYTLIDSFKVDYDNEAEIDEYINSLNNKSKEKVSLLSKVVNLATTGTANPNASSSQDGNIFKSRYRYSGTASDNTREFCNKMLSANKLYRKEDIERMSGLPVNKGWGPEGASTYDIFLYKGGGDCHHYWTREIYLKKSDVNSPLAKQYTPAETRKAGEIAPTNDSRVYQKPKDMPYNGFLPTNKRFQ